MSDKNSHHLQPEEEQEGSLPESEKIKAKEAAERDPDDLVHSVKLGKTAAEADPDDVIHRSAPTQPNRLGERDPDDVVHGG